MKDTAAPSTNTPTALQIDLWKNRLVPLVRKNREKSRRQRIRINRSIRGLMILIRLQGILQ